MADKLNPASDYQAKFSLQFCLAALALQGDVNLDTFTDTLVHDPRVLALARRVTFEPDPTQPYPRQYTAELVVTTRDGRRLSRTESATRGSLERPISAEDVRQKFEANARRALSSERVAALERAVLDLTDVPDVTALLDLAMPAEVSVG